MKKHWSISHLLLIVGLFTVVLPSRAVMRPYANNGKDLVYSTISDVTWLSNGNLLGSLMSEHGFETMVEQIDRFSPITISVADFYAPEPGLATRNGGAGFIDYLNAIQYAGINSWRLPTVTDLGNPGFSACSEPTPPNRDCGYNSFTNGRVSSNEYAELYYQELGSNALYRTDGVNRNLTGELFGLENHQYYFSNVQIDKNYQTGTPNIVELDEHLVFQFSNGRQLSGLNASSSLLLPVFDGHVEEGISPHNPVLPTSISGEGAFNFDLVGVGVGELVYIDPEIAIGYDYEVIEGSALISSVEFQPLPEDVDGYEIYTFGDTGPTGLLATVLGGEVYTFDTPVAGFTVLGIDAASMLDPTDASAFVTGLSFTESTVNISQTPITTYISAVPEPQTYAMLIVGLAVIVLGSRGYSGNTSKYRGEQTCS